MAADPVAALLREIDPERYFAQLLVPEPARPAVAALFAFDAELARMRDLARQPAAGEIRLRWWAEALAGERAEEARGHPLAAALLAGMERHRLPRQPLLAMVEARSFDLYDDAMPTRSDLEGYFGETVGATLRLAAIAVAPGAASGAAAGHGGCALGVALALRRMPALLARGQCPVPLDLISEAGLDPASFVIGGRGAQAAVAAFARFGRGHLDRFFAAVRPLPEAVRPVFTPVAVAARILEFAMENPGKALADGVAAAPLRERWAMMRAASGNWPR